MAMETMATSEMTGEAAGQASKNGMTPLGIEDPLRFINREVSWLEFNKRVLEEAWDERHPLLERVKFLAIFGANLDEFFMIRVSGLQAQRAAGIADLVADGLTPTEALRQISVRVEQLMVEAQKCWLTLKHALHSERIEVRRYEELEDADRAYLGRYFEEEIFPILTPLAVDPGHPFPHISNLSINLAVVVRDPILGERFARMKVPGSLPRLIEVPNTAPGVYRFAWIEDVIAHHLESLFPGLEPDSSYIFRVTRDADIEIQEDEAEDLLRTIEKAIGERHFGFVTRMELTPMMPERIKNLLTEHLEMDARNMVTAEGEMGLSTLMQLTKIDRPDLKFPPFVARTPPALTTGEDIFSLITRQDVLLHHPYESFTPVINFIETSARDLHVRAIKQTLYRLGPNSPIPPALMAARDADTQVAVLVELKARFDEENNIEWARKLEESGVHVVYGLIGLKTHSKVLLIVRREPQGIRRYLHLGTGNYNAVTARIYTDFSFLTADPDLGADATDLFNYLTGYSRQTRFRKMLVAPINLRQRMAQMILRETEHALAGRPARLVFKMNALVDSEMIDLMYGASNAGVKIDLIIRGICCLRPGIKNLSENITVISIVGRFLEHARAYYFENGGDPQLYCGSADLMPRNLDRRVEVVFPVEDADIRNHILNEILEVQLADNVQARSLNPDGAYTRIRPEPRKKRIDSQALFMEGEAPTPRRRRTVK